MEQKFLLVLVAVFISSAVATNVKWRTCNSTAGIAKNVVVHGCEVERCPLKKGTNASLSITFESNVNAESLTAVVYGEILNVPTKFALPNPNACEGVGIVCPIKSGETYTYTNTIEVKTIYPRIHHGDCHVTCSFQNGIIDRSAILQCHIQVTVDILWKLKDENGDFVMCVVIPAKIVTV